MATSLLIRGGTVVNADREFKADVLCIDGQIAAGQDVLAGSIQRLCACRCILASGFAHGGDLPVDAKYVGLEFAVRIDDGAATDKK